MCRTMDSQRDMEDTVVDVPLSLSLLVPLKLSLPAMQDATIRQQKKPVQALVEHTCVE